MYQEAHLRFPMQEPLWFVCNFSNWGMVLLCLCLFYLLHICNISELLMYMFTYLFTKQLMWHVYKNKFLNNFKFTINTCHFNRLNGMFSGCLIKGLHYCYHCLNIDACTPPQPCLQTPFPTPTPTPTPTPSHNTRYISWIPMGRKLITPLDWLKPSTSIWYKAL